MICDTCRKKLSKEPPVLIPEPDSPSTDAEETEVYVQTPVAEIVETPYSQSKARAKKYSRQKVEKITEAMQRTVISGEIIDDGCEMVQQLKEKFQATTKRSGQMQILKCFAKKLVCEDNSVKIWCVNLYCTKIKGACKRKGGSFSPRPKTWSFTAARNS